VILQEVTEGCSCEKYVVHEGCVANEGDTWTDFTENLKVGEMSIVKDNTGECPKCGKDIKFKEYYIVTNVEFRTK
jgi:predicted  nucleic acid-binding Zn ribbon protein